VPTVPTPAPPAPRRKIAIDLLIVGALAVLGFAGYRLAPLLTPRADVTLPPSTCDLGRTPCIVTLPDGETVEMAIEPRPVPAMKPLRITAQAHGDDVRAVAIDFAGVDMKMGFNRPQLTPAGNGRFETTTSLPICTTGTMHWQATVIIETRRARVAVPFRFESSGS